MKVFKIYGNYGIDGYGSRIYNFKENGIRQIREKWEGKNEFLSEYRNFSYLFLKNNPDFYKDIEMVIEEDTRGFDSDYEQIWQITEIYVCTEKFKQVCDKYNILFNFYPTILRGERGYLVTKDTLPRIFEAEEKRIEDSFDSYEIILDIVKYYGYTIFTDRSMVSLYITEEMAENFKKEGIDLNLVDTEQTTLGMTDEEIKKFLEEKKDEIQKEKDWVTNKEIKAMEVVKWCSENL